MTEHTMNILWAILKSQLDTETAVLNALKEIFSTTTSIEIVVQEVRIADIKRQINDIGESFNEKV